MTTRNNNHAASQRSITLRALPEDAYNGIKRALWEYNLAHPERKILQDELIAYVIRDWLARGGNVPDPDMLDSGM